MAPRISPCAPGSVSFLSAFSSAGRKSASPTLPSARATYPRRWASVSFSSTAAISAAAHLAVGVLERRPHFGDQVDRQVGVNQVLDGLAAHCDIGAREFAAGLRELLGGGFGADRQRGQQGEGSNHGKCSGGR